MVRSQWFNVLVILLVIIASIYLFQLVWNLLRDFSDILLLFGLAWLISLMLDPLIGFLKGKPLPAPVIRAAGRLLGSRAGLAAAGFHLSRATSVEIVYVAFGLFVIALIALFIPATVVQFSQLIKQLPDLVQQVPQLTQWLQGKLTDLNIPISVASSLQGALGAIQSITSTVLQNMVAIVSSLVTVIGNTLFVLILSVFFAMDRPALGRALLRLVPDPFDNDVHIFAQSVGHTFGGFFRAQMIQGLLMGVGTFLVMTAFGMQFSLVASFFAGIFMAIPLLGPFLALVGPLLVVLLTQAGNTIWLLVILLVLQFVIQNVIAPKLLSEALGLHPLVVFAALLIGLKLGGFWGAIFGVPIAGVIASMTIYVSQIWGERARAALGGPPTPTPAIPPSTPPVVVEKETRIAPSVSGPPPPAEPPGARPSPKERWTR